MHITNIHHRSWPVPAEAVGALLDTLSSSDDRLWPVSRWLPMTLDAGLSVGSRGGHGPVRYRVVRYVPGSEVVFEFDPDAGLLRGCRGTHAFYVTAKDGTTTLRHVIDMHAPLGPALRWALLVRPMHDALLEDALDGVEATLTGSVAKPYVWPWRVKYLRKLARRRQNASPRGSVS
ncbi:MAG: hypothetical protein JW940_18990 [Polyangiaceae bacterium]|nr:hypothetical protein [Polyangiaceae bacterium]